MRNADPHGDMDAIRQAKAGDYPTKKRMELWKERYEASAPIERAFGSVDVYSTYMEGLYAGRIKVRRHGVAFGADA